MRINSAGTLAYLEQNAVGFEFFSWWLLSLITCLNQTESVPDLVIRICDVVLRRIFSSGKPQGVGILEWGGDGNGEGRSVYEQPGTKVDGILSHQGGFPSK